MRFFGKTVKASAEQNEMNEKRLALGRQIDKLEYQLIDYKQRLVYIQSVWTAGEHHPEGLFYGDAELVYAKDDKAKLTAYSVAYNAQLVKPLEAEIAILKAQHEKLNEQLCLALFGCDIAEFRKRLARERIEREIANLKADYEEELARLQGHLAALD